MARRIDINSGARLHIYIWIEVGMCKEYSFTAKQKKNVITSTTQADQALFRFSCNFVLRP
jgi:hypothetical protein